jgi:hypothetical protein
MLLQYNDNDYGTTYYGCAYDFTSNHQAPYYSSTYNGSTNYSCSYYPTAGSGQSILRRRLYNR